MPQPSEVIPGPVPVRPGERAVLDRLFDRVYHELHALAHAQLARGRSETLNTTALVHEVYLKLVGSARTDVRDRRHFLYLAARAMRQITVDYARRARTRRRGGDMVRIALDPDRVGSDAVPSDAAELIALDRALTHLERLSERLVRVVELRFFAGLSVNDTAAVLELSPRTVKRDWQKARALLLQEIRDASIPPIRPTAAR